MEARQILLKAAALLEQGWCKGMSACAEDGRPMFSGAPTPPNATAKELALAPASFDVGGALERAASSQIMPRGVKKEDVRLLYWRVTDDFALANAKAMFCKTAGVLHPSVWNDRQCKSGEEAAAMLRRAAL